MSLTTHSGASVAVSAPSTMSRVRAAGKFLYVDKEKFYVKGVTYGPFRPDENGSEYHTPEQVAEDFAAMTAAGINTLRTYTVPPRWLLDAAEQHGLRVMVGLPWEQHVTFLDSARQRQDIEERVREGVQRCAEHPAVLCYAIGNEIPGSIVRWYGQRRIQRWIERLYHAAKEEDPDALVTYVNFPTTEYLELPFLDIFAFNVYLETEEELSGYLARLQNCAGERPLLMAEIGLDSLRNGEEEQAGTLDWQIRTVFAEGCCGGFVFSWTDEWHRGGFDIDDWCFGLTDRDRQPKPALQTVSQAYAAAPFPEQLNWPQVSVVVCTHNGSATIEQTLRHLLDLDYPDYEIIVVDDGSTDDTAERLAAFSDVHTIHTRNGGLSRARNVGMEAAQGEIVAYIDDDAYPDTHWLRYLAWVFMTTAHAGVGGANLSPPEDPWLAQCVALSPGGPNHVLFSDREAEHIPGCNMAFRKEALVAVNGFDQGFRIAGDDVDLCWRLAQLGHTLGFHPAAMVWHHRRPSLRKYLRQQYHYGRAEGILEKKWPQKYNGFGHVSWRGRIYGPGGLSPMLQRWRIYYGVWGSAGFQSLYMQPAGLLPSLPLMPEWYLLIAALVVIGGVGVLWPPLSLALVGAAVAIALPAGNAWLSACKLTAAAPTEGRRWRWRFMVSLMHLLQPATRLHGRLRGGRRPWQRLRWPRFAWPLPRRRMVCSEQWHAAEDRLAALEQELWAMGARSVARGGPLDRWDLEVRGGLFGGTRLQMAIEEHGGGTQVVRLRSRPYLPTAAVWLSGLFVALAVLVWAYDGDAALALGAIAAGVAGTGLVGASTASGRFIQATGQPQAETAASA